MPSLSESKATLRITGLSLQSSHRQVVWHLISGSSRPGAVRSKGLGCSPVSGTRAGSERRETDGPYPAWVGIFEGAALGCRRTGGGRTAGVPICSAKAWPGQPSPEGINAEGMA